MVSLCVLLLVHARDTPIASKACELKSGTNGVSGRARAVTIALLMDYYSITIALL